MTDKLDLTILLPTYNEANNIAPLLRAITRTLAEEGVAYEIVFVDDSSDMTPDIIERMQESYPMVRLIRRPEERRTGLATALVEGFQAARGEYILCMDSDLQHPPRTIPDLYRAITADGADMVVATRYRLGGSAEGLRGLYRRFVSQLCRFAAWAFVPQTRKTSDPGSGFFIFRRSLVERMDFTGLQGFKILIDLLARTKGLKVAEVPFTFVRRVNDVSKATVEQGIAFFRHLVALKWQNWFRTRPPKTIESAVPRPPKPTDWTGLFLRIIGEGLMLALIIGTGWYLIGYYAAFNYLYTGYEDWIYHAFRVKSLEEHGLVAWDHIWSNGINYWKLYQYVPHYLILGVVALTGLPITKVLLFSLIGLYIGFRVAIYAILRFLGVSRLWALLPAIASYTIVQEWGSMQDYSIYIAFIFIPLYLLLWIKTFRDLRWVYVLAAVAGASWVVHPALGFNASILLGFLAVFSRLKSDFGKIARVGVVYFVGATPFLTSYLTAGYFFTNPLFKSYIYLSTSVLPDYSGLSMVLWTLLGLVWALVVWRSDMIPAWAKVLLGYASFYIILVFLGQHDYLPQFLVQFQFSRGLTAIALILVIAAGVILESVFRETKSFGLTILAVIFLAASMVHAVDIASRHYVAPPVMEMDNVVARYFESQALPRGSVYVDNVSEATYFAPAGIRYVTSYNEHMQPHPYSTRLRVLLHSRLGYTGIAKSHITNIENYATVLGIEYLFLPAASPLVAGLTQKEDPQFVQMAAYDYEALKDAIVVLRNTQPIVTAFAVERAAVPDGLLERTLPDPTLHVGSYRVWDAAIAEMAALMRSDQVLPLSVEFVPTNRLIIRTDAKQSLAAMKNPLVLLQQSYNMNWQGTFVDGSRVAPLTTTLRLMTLPLAPEVREEFPLTLENSWPAWHWPMQAVGPIGVVLVLLWTLKINGFLNTWSRSVASTLAYVLKLK